MHEVELPYDYYPATSAFLALLQTSLSFQGELILVEKRFHIL